MTGLPDPDVVIGVVLDRYGRTFSDQVGFDPLTDKPAPLFKLLVMSLLLSARIASNQALAATRGLFDQGWTTPKKLAATSWEERTRVLNRSGYARYDESTARMLGDTTHLLLDRWHGDLRELRHEAGCQPEAERELLQEFKGIGDVGADIYFREVQPAWSELMPFLDRRARSIAEALGLPPEADQLRSRVDSDRDFARLAAGLVRVGLDHGEEDVRAATSDRAARSRHR